MKPDYRIEIHLINDSPVCVDPAALPSGDLVLALDEDVQIERTTEAIAKPADESGFVGHEPGDSYVTVKGKVARE